MQEMLKSPLLVAMWVVIGICLVVGLVLILWIIKSRKPSGQTGTAKLVLATGSQKKSIKQRWGLISYKGIFSMVVSLMLIVVAIWSVPLISEWAQSLWKLAVSKEYYQLSLAAGALGMVIFFIFYDKEMAPYKVYMMWIMLVVSVLLIAAWGWPTIHSWFVHGESGQTEEVAGGAMLAMAHLQSTIASITPEQWKILMLAILGVILIIAILRFGNWQVIVTLLILLFAGLMVKEMLARHAEEVRNRPPPSLTSYVPDGDFYKIRTTLTSEGPVRLSFGDVPQYYRTCRDGIAKYSGTTIWIYQSRSIPAPDQKPDLVLGADREGYIRIGYERNKDNTVCLRESLEDLWVYSPTPTEIITAYSPLRQ